MCRDSSRGRGHNYSNRARHNTKQLRGTRSDRPQTLSESRCANYGISATNITMRKVQISRQPIDYVSLNDGYDNEEEPQARKKWRKESYRPRNAPSATRISAHRRMGSLNTASTEGDVTVDTPASVPSMSAPLSGPAQADNTLPDLVVNRPGVLDADYQPPAATNMLEDLEDASTLLSLGDSLEDTLEEDDKNALLMPIGGANNPEDIAPQPIRLDQASVDNTIAGLVETEELKKDTEKQLNPLNPTVAVPVPTDQLQAPMDPPPNMQSPDVSVNTKKGLLKTKMYVLKKPEVKWSFKCSECNVVKSSIQKLNEHH